VIVDISYFMIVKILDERLSPSRIKYRCELKPLWLATDLVEEMPIGRVYIRNYKNGLLRVNRLRRLRDKKRKYS
jgi:hypothetical protein